MKVSRLISVVVPLYNESENLPLLHQALVDATKKLPYTFEFIFVDDGSTDNSVAVAKALHETDGRIRVIEFARNFGKEAAVSAGLHNAKGDAAIIMDADLQHPPTLLFEFIAKWEDGAEVVVGVRKNDAKENWFKKIGSRTFYKIMQRISHTDITPHATDFRLLDRVVIDAFNNLSERNRMTRGLIDWLGFKREYIAFKAPDRQHGEASYTFKKLFGLAVNSFTTHSMLPLRIAGYTGVIILVISAPLGLFIIIEKYIMGDPLGMQFSGPAISAVVLLFLVGIVLACLGLVALYIAHIHTEVIGRPLYIARPEAVPVIEDES